MKLSIITVCYNSENFILDTIRSVDSQTSNRIEHIIIDGGSTDSTLSLLSYHKKPYRHIFSEPDNGIYDAMNKGILKASGDIIGFLHSDDIFNSIDTVEKVLSIFESSNLDCIWGDITYLERNFSHMRNRRHWVSCDYTKAIIKKGWIPPHPAFFVKSNIYVQFGNFNCKFRFAADYDFMLRILLSSMVKKGYFHLTIVCMRIGGFSNNGFCGMVTQNREILISLKDNGINVNPFIFIFFKFVNKLKQFKI